MAIIPSHSYRPLTLLSSCFCTWSGCIICETAALVPLTVLFLANSRSPLQKESDTLFYNTAARLRTKTPIAGRTACLKRCRLIAQKNNKNDIPSHSYRPLTLLSSCFCTWSGSMVYQTVTFVPLSLLFWANSRSPVQKEIDTRFYNTAARLRTKTLIAGRTASLKRFRLIVQRNNKK